MHKKNFFFYCSLEFFRNKFFGFAFAYLFYSPELKNVYLRLLGMILNPYVDIYFTSTNKGGYTFTRFQVFANREDDFFSILLGYKTRKNNDVRSADIRFATMREQSRAKNGMDSNPFIESSSLSEKKDENSQNMNGNIHNLTQGIFMVNVYNIHEPMCSFDISHMKEGPILDISENVADFLDFSENDGKEAIDALTYLFYSEGGEKVFMEKNKKTKKN